MDNKAINIKGTHTSFELLNMVKQDSIFPHFDSYFMNTVCLKVPIWGCDLTIVYLFAIIIVMIKGRALESVKKNILKWLSSGCFKGLLYKWLSWLAVQCASVGDKKSFSSTNKKWQMIKAKNGVTRVPKSAPLFKMTRALQA